jgi:V/A-type H+-transporting ATPase subunit D
MNGTAMAEHVPPGRAGRLWLLGRLASARRSVELLDRKRQLLRRELVRLATLRDETSQRWVIACAEAERWGLRATVLGGAFGMALSAAPVAGRANVEVAWRNTMGVRHPDEPFCALASLSPAEAASGNAAVAPAAAAYRRALEAAVSHAAADTSWRLLDDELHTTARRLRAIERLRLPALSDALRRLELRLDELEQEERVVTRWARRRRQGQFAGPAASTNPDNNVDVTS